ncbi:MAG: hypothetical protein JWP27_657 [Flaviaesturariibacter sp.]|nr:hypothetical protein [Flaviaesturariibacter sp.]
MQTVFKLLRHNQELGPFTIGELLQQQLTPDDLVWVDGESTAWAHPQEMENLKYALPEELVKKTKAATPAPVAPKVDEQPPVQPKQKPVTYRQSDEIERKAEELRQRTLAYKKTPGYYQPAAWAEATRPGILPGAQSDVDFHYHSKPGLPVGETLMGAMVVGLLALGWYGGGKDLFKAPREVASAVAVKMTATEENAAIGAPARATDTTVVAINRTDSLPSTGTELVAAPKPAPHKASEPKDTEVTVPRESTSLASVPPPVETPKKEEEKPVKTISTSETKEQVKADPAPSATSAETATAEPEKKKGLGHMLKGLFKKKKKGDDKSADEAKD